MPDIRILGVSSDEPLDFLPLNAEFDADISESDSEVLGTAFGTDDAQIGATFKDTGNSEHIGFSDNSMGLSLKMDSGNAELNNVGFRDVVIEGGSGGGCDCDKNYENLNNKPSINNVVVEGQKTGAEYGLSYELKKTSFNDQQRLIIESSFGETSGVDLDEVEVDYATYNDVMTYLNS